MKNVQLSGIDTCGCILYEICDTIVECLRRTYVVCYKRVHIAECTLVSQTE